MFKASVIKPPETQYI